MAVRGIIDHALAAFRSTSKARHIRFRIGFVKKHELRQVQRGLIGLPLLAMLFHVGPVLLTRS